MIAILVKSMVALVIILVSSLLTLDVGNAEQSTYIKISQSWSRATTSLQKTGAVFFKIKNDGTHSDRLIGVETDIANYSSLHEMIHEDGVMRMRSVEEGIKVLVNGEVVLAPGHKHIMLMGLKKQLIENSNIPLTLIFERSGEIDILAIVLSAGSRGPTQSSTSEMKHKKHMMKK